MVLDTLSGRTPLYRLTEFFEEKDAELLLGTAVGAERFCDYNLGRSMDKIFETGTHKIFSRLAQTALTVFGVDPRRLNFDTTSVSVFGDYDLVDPPFDITYGYSKDKRPDLKQFLVSMLCVDRNIPILGTTTDGNASDKTLNNELLTNISKYMADHGLQPGAYVYVADAAFVTQDNLDACQDRTWFLTRLPATYNECSRIVRQAVASDRWIDIGPLAEERDRPKRPVARYRAYDGVVELYGKTYRAIVVHSSAHDKRRHKRIDRLLKQERKQLEADCKQATAAPYYCRADARAAGEKLIRQIRGQLSPARDRCPKSAQIRPRQASGRQTQAGTALRIPIDRDPFGGSGQSGPFAGGSRLFRSADQPFGPARRVASPGTAFPLQKPDRHREELQLPEGPGHRQQHLPQKGRTDRSAGPGPADIPVDLALNGTLHAPVCRNQRLHAARLGASADEKTDRVYDDDQVCIRDGRHDWPTPAAGKTVEAVSAGVFASPGRTRRGIHGSIEARKMGNRSLSGVLNVRYSIWIKLDKRRY